MRRYKRAIFAYAVASTGSRQDAEEVTQDVFVKVYRAAHRFDSQYAFTTWLYKIASNTCKNKLRGRRRRAVSLDNEDSPVTAVSLAERWLETADGQRQPFERLVATAALPALMDLIVDDLPPDAAAARAALRWVRVLNVALGVRGPAPSPEHWLYFPDPELPFYRVGFPSNHGELAPSGCHTVSIEVSVDPAAADVAAEAAAAERALAKLGLLEPSHIEVRIETVMDPAYVVFDHRRREAVAALRRYVASHGVLLAGRWAEWKYSAMEDAILDGMAVARRIAGDR